MNPLLAQGRFQGHQTSIEFAPSTLHVQGRRALVNCTQGSYPSTPARTGQTIAPRELTLTIAFNPCTYRADKDLAQDFAKDFLQPLHVQGRRQL